MRIPGGRRLRRVASRLHHRERRGTDGAAVLMYHRVADTAVDPWELCVSPRHFEEHLEVLGRHCVVSVDDLVGQAVDGAFTPSSVALTLDDGYRDTVEVMLPAVRRARVPVTVYVTTGGLDTATSCWWDRLADSVYRPRHLPPTPVPILAGFEHTSWTRDELHLALWQRLADEPPATQRAYLDELASWAGFDAEPDAELLGEAGVARLHAEPLVTIGAHTVNHRLLPELDAAERHREIVGSSERLAALTGAPIRHFAYPHGRYDDVTVEDVKHLGFASAMTTDPGVVTVGGDVHRLPRVQVPNVDGERFEAWLGQFVQPGSP